LAAFILPYTIDLSILPMLDHEGLLDHIQRAGQEFYHRQASGKPLQPA